MSSFQYRAETHAGQRMRGAIECDDLATAEQELQAMGLRVLELSPTSTPAAAIRLKPADLETFNEYLVQISTAGLPIEQGLRALSAELHSGKLKSAIEGLVADLERGHSLEEAVAARRESFPPLYARLLEAGIQSANLPAVLHRFGRHMETVAELRESLWRACAYPIVVILSLLLLLGFLGYFVLPQYIATMGAVSGFRPKWRPELETQSSMIPTFTVVMLYVGQAMPYVLAGLVVLLVIYLIVWASMRASGRDRTLIDSFVLRLPLIGPALRASYVSSWLEVVAIGTASGLDLPRSAQLAGSAVGLPSIERDSAALAEQVNQGQPVAAGRFTRLPATVPLAMDLAQASSNLPLTLSALAEQFRTQARRRIQAIPGVVMPALLLITGVTAGGILYGLWMPLANLLRRGFFFF